MDDSDSMRGDGGVQDKVANRSRGDVAVLPSSFVMKNGSNGVDKGVFTT